MAQSDETIIDLRNVNFFYNKGTPMEAHVLKDISLSANHGDYISFFGPSGSGKSTMLNIVSGIDKATSGEILMYNHDILKFKESEMDRYRQIGIGFIFQNYNLIPSLRSIDNVTLPMSFVGVPRGERRKKAKEIFKKLNIEDLIYRYPHELSGGQQQRVGIARALANDPHILLADEPVGNLDSVNAKNVLDLLRDLNVKDGKTIIMVTHEKWSLRDVKTVYKIRDGSIESVEKGTGGEEIPEDAEVGTAAAIASDIYTPKTQADQVSMLASMVLNKYSVYEIKRFERLLNDRLEGKLSKDEFIDMLDKPFNAGGVGLWKQSVERISEYVEGVIQEKGVKEKLGEGLIENLEFPVFEEMINIRNWLIKGINVSLNSEQILRLDEIISDRIRNSIDAKNFQKILNLSKKRGGIGFKVGHSLKILERMELIMVEKIRDIAGSTDIDTLIDASVTDKK